MERPLEAMGAIAVVSTESLQFPTFEEVLRAYNAVFERLPNHLQDRVATSLERLVTGLGDHVMTRSLEEALVAMTETLRDAGYADTARTVAEARRQMVSTAGTLAARSSRVQEATSGEDGSSSG